MSIPLPADIELRTGFLATETNEFSRMQSQREQLTSELRNLAAELDCLDRRLADLDWRSRRRLSGVGDAAISGERTALETQRGYLTGLLRGLARGLNDLDQALASRKGQASGHTPRVGTCPDCGYPSLDFGLCAFCRPRRAH